jgi:hypothetical protein
VEEREGYMKNIISSLIVLLLVGCATDRASVGFVPVCRHTAVMCSTVIQDVIQNADVDIAFGPIIYADGTESKTLTHALARVFVEGRWRWIVFENGVCQLRDKQDIAFNPKQSMHPKEYLDRIYNKGMWHKVSVGLDR